MGVVNAPLCSENRGHIGLRSGKAPVRRLRPELPDYSVQIGRGLEQVNWEWGTMCKEPRPEGLSPVFEEYENGKHRRYELLFKVNGAAFVIAGLFAKAD